MLIDVIKQCPTLHYLDLSGLWQVADILIQNLSQFCPRLEILLLGIVLFFLKILIYSDQCDKLSINSILQLQRLKLKQLSIAGCTITGIKICRRDLIFPELNLAELVSRNTSLTSINLSRIKEITNKDIIQLSLSLSQHHINLTSIDLR